jgi:sec-independent protein translocase protein TatA
MNFFGDLFDSPWKILIIAAFFIIMFGSRKLPDAARSLGKSMRILKSEVQGLHDDEPEAPAASTVPAAPALQTPAPVAATDPQTQIDALSKQLADLQQSVAVNAASPDSVPDSAQAK